MSYIESLDFNEIGGDFEGYEPPSEFVRPPNAGKYTLARVTEGENIFKAGTFEISKGEHKGDEHAWANFKASVIADANGSDEFAGRTLYVGVNTMKGFSRPYSSVQDYLLAAQAPIEILREATRENLISEAKANAESFPDNNPYLLEQVTGPFQAKLSWEFRCKDCEVTFLKGQKNPKAPKNFDGPKPTVKKDKTGATDYVQKCPLCDAKVGAQAVVVGFIVE